LDLTSSARITAPLQFALEAHRFNFYIERFRNIDTLNKSPISPFLIVRPVCDIVFSVGMCGDGATDAPAPRHDQMGIAVSTATDVAMSAAGILRILPAPVRRCQADCRSRRM
jgi:hypothetical protein